jgi:hypothetical protein
MTTERKQRVLALIAKLGECRIECDSLYDDEQMQCERLEERRMRESSYECKENADKLMDAFCEIEEAIEALQEVDK